MTRPPINRIASGLDDETEAEFLARMREAEGVQEGFSDVVPHSYELPEIPPEQCQRCGAPLKHGGNDGTHFCS